MSINYRILKACDHSPRHKSAMISALNALQSPSVARCAAVLHKMCKNLSIADFPNPFPRDEPDHMLWGAIFLGETPLTDDKTEVGVTAPKRAWPAAWEGDPPVVEPPTEPGNWVIDEDGNRKFFKGPGNLGGAKGATEQTAGPGAPDDPRDPNAAPADEPKTVVVDGVRKTVHDETEDDSGDPAYIAPEPSPAGYDAAMTAQKALEQGVAEGPPPAGDASYGGNTEPATDPHLDPNDPYYPVANRQPKAPVETDAAGDPVRNAGQEGQDVLVGDGISRAELDASDDTPVDKPEV